MRRERERERRGGGGGGWNRLIFFLGDRIHGSQNIYRIINIYIIQQLDESISKSDIIYI